MNDDVLIRAENVSKRFCRDLKRSLFYGVQDIASDLLGRDRSEAGLRKSEFWANQGVSFELRRGECLGLIGHNGAGKTTLLKMLNGLIKPDKGSIEMRGRVGALIALGAGFNPILNGRENVYIAGAVLGLTKREIDRKYAEIVEFSELEAFMESPVQSYSSGMQVRLGFAVATAIDPEILILDEVLAVGDQQFRSKCLERIGRLSKHAAVVFVSHSMGQIRHICDRVMLLKSGKLIHDGNVADGIGLYNSIAAKDQKQKSVHTSSEVAADLFLSEEQIRLGDSLNIELRISSRKRLVSKYSRIVIVRDSGEPAAIVETGEAIDALKKGVLQLRIQIHELDLASGMYSLNVYISGSKKSELLYHGINLAEFRVVGPEAESISYVPTATIVVDR